MFRLRSTYNAAGLLLALAAWPATVRAVDTEDKTVAPLVVTAGKALVIDSPLNIERVMLSAAEIAEAVAVNPREVLINGKNAGETSLIIWQEGGARLSYDLKVRPNPVKLEAVRRQMARDLPGQDVSVNHEGDTVFLSGTVRNLVSASRAAAIAAAAGLKVVNLLHVDVPPVEAQILLKVRFADVDRSISSQLGLNLFSTGAANTVGGITTQQFAPPTLVPSTSGTSPGSISLTNALNLFLFRPDINLGATIEALEAKNLLQILAEPNVLAMNGKEASFVAGGEFPVPIVQGGANIGAVTIQFREYGVRIHFLPVVTPRGTIRLEVTPEVSSLDYTNAVVLQGFTVPALATRRVRTEIELESGQSFGIAGLLDNRFNETLDKVPGIGNIPLLGKLFQSRTLSKTNSELLVLVTPEMVRPIPEGQEPPAVPMPHAPLNGTMKDAPRTPGMAATGPVSVKPVRETVPLEELIEIQKREQGPVPGTEAAPESAPNAPLPQPAVPPPASPANGSGH